MAWKDITLDPLLRSSYVFGDKPYGNYWEEVEEKNVPLPPQEAPKVSLDDVVAALTKANIPVEIKPAKVDGTAIESL